MGKTKIEWADRVFNPITGCSKVSPGCDHCYAERMAKRLAGRYGYPQDEPFRVTFHPERLEEPFHFRIGRWGWKRGQRVFTCSMGDLFHPRVKPEWIDAVLDVIAACPQHTFIILTKRPENIDYKLYAPEKTWPVRKLGGGDFLSNLWLGVSVEDQATADERIPKLLGIPAAKHIISVEPMLGPVDLITGYSLQAIAGLCKKKPFLDWVILGGETGPGARPMHPEWARAVRDQCKAAGVPFFFKQMSCKATIPDDLMIREFPD